MIRKQGLILGYLKLNDLLPRIENQSTQRIYTYDVLRVMFYTVLFFNDLYIFLWTDLVVYMIFRWSEVRISYGLFLNRNNTANTIWGFRSVKPFVSSSLTFYILSVVKYERSFSLDFQSVLWIKSKNHKHGIRNHLKILLNMIQNTF